MRRVATSIANLIRRFIDFLYPPFSKWIPKLMFRYAFCGTANIVFDWVLYFILYNFVVGHNNIDLGFVVISPHILTLCITFPITLASGFYLARFVTFTSSTLKESSQLFRYILVVLINLAINYWGLKLLVEMCHIYPTPSKMLITTVTVAFSYVCQKYFTFKK